MWFALRLGGAGVLIIAALFALMLGFNMLLIALVWNWLGLHAVFGAATLGFWPVLGVAIILAVVGA